MQIARTIIDTEEVFIHDIDVFHLKAEAVVAAMKQYGAYINDKDAKRGTEYAFSTCGLSFWRSHAFSDMDMQKPGFQKLDDLEKENRMRKRYFECFTMASQVYFESIHT